MPFQLGHDPQCEFCHISQLCRRSDTGVSDGLVRHMLLRGDTLYLQDGDCSQLHWLCSGAVKLERREGGGGVAMLAIITPGQMVGLEDMFATGHFARATALQDAVVTSLNRAKFELLLEQPGKLAKEVIRGVAAWARQIGNHYARSAYSNTRRRLAATLLDLAAQYGTPVTRGVLLPLRLSRSELGEMIGASAETISRQLKNFKRQGLVYEKNKGEFILLDKQRLQRISRNWSAPETLNGNGNSYDREKAVELEEDASEPLELAMAANGRGRKD